jgi:hypothetical protein
MKTSVRSSRIAAAIAAFSMASVALAQPPPQGGPLSPPPGPGSPGSGYPQPLGRVVIPPPDPSGHRLRHSHIEIYTRTDSSVASVQRALKRQGYYAGPVDGDAGGGTRAAIRSFRRDHGLGSSTRIDGALLRALRL